MSEQVYNSIQQSIFENAVLLHLSISKWGGSKKLPASVMAKLADSDRLVGTKYLVNPDAIDPIRKAAATANAYVLSHNLPFPIKGINMIPRKNITETHAMLTLLKQKFDVEVDYFCASYLRHREEGMEMLQRAGVANLSDYPMDIRARFSFNWQFLALTMPGQAALSEVSPDLVREQEQRFIATLQEAKDTAIMVLRQEFVGLVEHMRERLAPGDDGKPKRFNATMTTNFTDFISHFENRNIFNDAALADLVQEARSILQGVDAEALRNADTLRAKIKGEMDVIKLRISTEITPIMPRFIHFDEGNAA